MRTRSPATRRTIPPPSVNWDAWYANANPGPYYPCTTVSGTPPAFESGDQGVLPNVDLTKRNNSILSVVDLTPSSSYSCHTVGGELTWNATTKVLAVNGTMYIDGSAKIENGPSTRTRGSQRSICRARS